MNHLAHFYLASPDKVLMAGGFLGDFVKGRLAGQLPSRLELGIRLHRAIDAYTDNHPRVRQSQKRFDPKFRRFSGIMCDIVYDHLLALHWQQHSTISLSEFSNIAYQAVLGSRPHAPVQAIDSILRMQSIGALEHYREEQFVDRALKNISNRLSRANPLAEGFAQFSQHKQALDEDFSLFLPEVTGFAKNWIIAAQ